MPIGRNPLSLQLTGPAQVNKQADKQALPPFRLLSTNATGEPLPAIGTLRLLARRYRPNPPGVPGPTPETADNEAAPELLKTLAFDTHASPDLDLSAALAALPTGRYRLEALAAGADSARARLDFTLYDSQAATVPYATPDWFVVPADTVAPGQPATVLLGSSEADARILLEVERGGQLLRHELLTLRAGEQRRLLVASGPADARGPLRSTCTPRRCAITASTATTPLFGWPSGPRRCNFPSPLSATGSNLASAKPGASPSARPTASPPMPSYWPRSMTRVWMYSGRTAFRGWSLVVITTRRGLGGRGSLGRLALILTELQMMGRGRKMLIIQS